MIIIDHLDTKLSSRYEELDSNQDGNKNTQFADIIVEGKSIYNRLRKYDMVPALGSKKRFSFVSNKINIGVKVG